MVLDIIFFFIGPRNPKDENRTGTLIHRFLGSFIMYALTHTHTRRVLLLCCAIGTHSTKTVRSEHEKCAHTVFDYYYFVRKKRTITVLRHLHISYILFYMFWVWLFILYFFSFPFRLFVCRRICVSVPIIFPNANIGRCSPNF